MIASFHTTLLIVFCSNAPALHETLCLVSSRRKQKQKVFRKPFLDRFSSISLLLPADIPAGPEQTRFTSPLSLFSLRSITAINGGKHLTPGTQLSSAGEPSYCHSQIQTLAHVVLRTIDEVRNCFVQPSCFACGAVVNNICQVVNITDIFTSPNGGHRDTSAALASVSTTRDTMLHLYSSRGLKMEAGQHPLQPFHSIHFLNFPL